MHGIEKRDKFSHTDFTFKDFYYGWINELVTKIIPTMVWDCTIPYHEIEKILILNGSCGIAKKDGVLMAFYGNPNKYTDYYDRFKYYNIYSPYLSKSLKDGKDVAYGVNNSMCTSEGFVLHRYAMELAHLDITICLATIHYRDFGNTPIVETEKEKMAYDTYRKDLISGKVMPYVAQYSELTQLPGSTKNIDINSLYILQENLITQFLLNYGIRSGIEKKGNMISEEFTSALPRIRNSVEDRLRCRQEFAEKINRTFGTNWSVKLSPNIEFMEGAVDNA